MSCCESCGGITLFKGEDGTTIYNGIGAPTIVANEGDFYIDTNTYEIYGPYTGGSWGSGTSLVGPVGPPGAPGLPGSPGVNGTNGINANSEYGNTVFVDKIYGDDLTGTRERFDLPFLTINAALTVAVSGDTVYVRSGNYTGNIVLKNGVNLYFERVLVTGQLTDNAVGVSCNILGNLSLVFAGNNPISITGIDSDVSIQMDTIQSTGNGIRVEPGIGNSCTFSLVARRIVGQQVNYFITCDGISKIFIDIKESMETPATTSDTIQFKGIFISHFEGEFYFKCPKVYIGNSIFAGGGIFFEEEVSTTGGKIYLEIEDVVIDYNFASPNEAYSINKVGVATTILNIKNLKCISRGGLLVTGNGHSIGYLRYEGNIISEREPAMRYASNHKCIIKNSSLKRNSGGSNLDEALVIGNPTGYSAVTNGIDDQYKLEIINTEVIKDKGGLAGAASGIIAKSGLPVINIKDCDIYGLNGFLGTSATSPILLEGDIFFKNTVGNATLSPTVTDISAAGGFTADGGLDLYDYID